MNYRNTPQTADNIRSSENGVRIATIKELDEAKLKLKVWLEGFGSAWLDWPAEIGRNFIRWRPLRKGQQVVLASPSGDYALSVIVGMLYHDKMDSPSNDPDIDLIQFENGDFIRHDMKTGTFRIKGIVEIDGTLTLSQPVTAPDYLIGTLAAE